jgi:hypothetical protein
MAGVRTRTCAWIIAAGFPAAILFGGQRQETLQTLVQAERANLSLEARRLADLSRRLEGLLAELTQASRAIAEAGSSDTSDIEQSSENLFRAASAVDRLILDQRLSAARIADMQSRIGLLERQIAADRAKDEDALSGRWRLRVDPGSQEGEMRLTLDGTLVVGQYRLEGGFSGSLRGTLVGSRLRLERIDSRLGYVSIFYGRLGDDGRISGTWEASEPTASPTSGSWAAQRAGDEREDK